MTRSGLSKYLPALTRAPLATVLKGQWQANDVAINALFPLETQQQNS